VDLAAEFGFWVIADNPYREVRFPSSQPAGPVDGAPGAGSVFNAGVNVIHVNSFSKTLGPGLRLGWLVLPSRIVEDAVQLRTRVDSQSSSLVQGLVTRYLTANGDTHERTLAAANARYAARARFLVEQLQSQLPGVFDAVQPEGGYFLWARLRDDTVDPYALHAAAAEEGLNYQSGYAFPSGPGTDADRYLRLAYGDNPEPVLGEAVARLARAYRKVAG
jgi:2-aminoadipate transaminase